MLSRWSWVESLSLETNSKIEIRLSPLTMNAHPKDYSLIPYEDENRWVVTKQAFSLLARSTLSPHKSSSIKLPATICHRSTRIHSMATLSQNQQINTDPQHLNSNTFPSTPTSTPFLNQQSQTPSQKHAIASSRRKKPNGNDITKAILIALQCFNFKCFRVH